MMPFNLSMLKFTHSLLSSKRIAKRILKDEGRAEDIIKDVKSMMEHDLKVVAEYGSASQVVGVVKWFIKQAKEYYKNAVFSADEDIIVVLLRDEEGYANIVEQMVGEYKALHQIDKDSQLDAEMRQIIADAQKEEQEMQEEIIGLFRLVRRALYHQHDAWMDELKGLDKRAQLRHKLKEMRRHANEPKKLTHKEGSFLKNLGKAIDKAEHNHNTIELNNKFGKTVNDLHEAMKSEIDVLRHLFDDARFVIRYSIMEFFEFDALVRMMSQYIASLKEHEIIFDDAYNECEAEFGDLEHWLHREEKELFRILKKFRRVAQKELND